MHLSLVVYVPRSFRRRHLLTTAALIALFILLALAGDGSLWVQPELVSREGFGQVHCTRSIVHVGVQATTICSFPPSFKLLLRS